MASQTIIHTRNSYQFEDLQMSARDFYTRLKNLVEQYHYPGVVCTPITMKERGLFSPRREYLRISKQRYHYYVCASPFGRSFFISWWLQEDAHTTANIARKIGLLGKAIASRLESKTFYEHDTEQMFTSSVNEIIKMAVEKIKADRAIAEIYHPPHHDNECTGVNRPIL